MKMANHHRRWLLAAGLVMTLGAVAWIGNQDTVATTVVDAAPLKNKFSPQMNSARPGSGGDLTLLVINRQRMPEHEKDMFVGKSWYVPPIVPKSVQPIVPPLPFTYMGKLMEDGEKVVIILSKQNHNYEVREGDTLDQSYHIDEIRPPVMTLTYLPLNIKQTLRIGESN